MKKIRYHKLEDGRSSVISAMAYDPSDCGVYVEFKRNGDVWRYEGVGLKIFEDLLAATSIGSEFSRSVKQWFDGSPVDESVWELIVTDGAARSCEGRAAAYQASNKGLLAQLRKSPKALGF